jgi:site-specific recombinase XerD
VFPSQVGTKLNRFNVERAFRNAVVKAKIADLRFHDLRHTFATRLVQAGKDLYKVQKLLGHKSAAMTQRYAHHYSESLRDAVMVPDGGQVRVQSQFGHSKQKGATLIMGNSLN